MRSAAHILACFNDVSWLQRQGSQGKMRACLLETQFEHVMTED